MRLNSRTLSGRRTAGLNESGRLLAEVFLASHARVWVVCRQSADGRRRKKADLDRSLGQRQLHALNHAIPQVRQLALKLPSLAPDRSAYTMVHRAVSSHRESPFSATF